MVMDGEASAWCDLRVSPGMASLFAFSTAGDAANGLLFGWEIATLQKWALIYLGVSSLAFVVVWIVGAVRRQ
jgi:hypothetical protein